MKVITEKDRKVHVSGHPYQDELRQMLRWLRPKVAIPVHGEPRQLARHAEIATEEGIAETLVIADGAMVRLAPGLAAVIDEVPTGRLAIGGGGPMPADGAPVQERRRMMFNGSIVAMVVLSANGEPAAKPRLVVRGVDVPETSADAAATAIAERIRDLPRARRATDDEVTLAVRQALRAELRQFTVQRPAIDVEIVRLDAPVTARRDIKTEANG